MLGRLMTATLLNSFVERGNYPVDEYLNDLFNVVWQPLDNASEWKNQARRQLERSYVQNLDRLLNPAESEVKTVAGQRAYSGDAMLYVMQQLEKIETYCQKQLRALSTQPSSINALHYTDLLRELRLIRERRTTLH